MNIRKCNKCGALIKVLNDCKCDNCGIICCDEEMLELVSNSVDASFEKHVPQYEINNGEIIVKVNHVMEEEHYIEWIACCYGNREEIVYFKPNEEVVASFKYVSGSTLYAYCNLHSLWSSKVE